MCILETYIATIGIIAHTRIQGKVKPKCFAPEETEGHRKMHDVPVESQEQCPYPNSGGMANTAAFNQLTPTSVQYNRIYTDFSERIYHLLLQGFHVL